MTKTTFEFTLRKLDVNPIKGFIAKNEYLFSEFTHFTDVLAVSYFHGEHYFYAIKGKVSTPWRDDIDKLFVFDITDNDGLNIKTYTDGDAITVFTDLLKRITDKGVDDVKYVNLA